LREMRSCMEMGSGVVGRHGWLFINFEAAKGFLQPVLLACSHSGT
jgi:hypothetical protein